MDLMSTALSGLKAASSGIASTANNVANVNTPDYKARPTDPAVQPQSTLGALGSRESADKFNVDLAAELTNLQVQSGTYKANLKVVQTANEMLGTTLNIKA